MIKNPYKARHYQTGGAVGAGSLFSSLIPGKPNPPGVYAPPGMKRRIVRTADGSLKGTYVPDDGRAELTVIRNEDGSIPKPTSGGKGSGKNVGAPAIPMPYIPPEERGAPDSEISFPPIPQDQEPHTTRLPVKPLPQDQAQPVAPAPAPYMPGGGDFRADRVFGMPPTPPLPNVRIGRGTPVVPAPAPVTTDDVPGGYIIDRALDGPIKSIFGGGDVPRRPGKRFRPLPQILEDPSPGLGNVIDGTPGPGRLYGTIEADLPQYRALHSGGQQIIDQAVPEAPIETAPAAPVAPVAAPVSSGGDDNTHKTPQQIHQEAVEAFGPDAQPKIYEGELKPRGQFPGKTAIGTGLNKIGDFNIQHQKNLKEKYGDGAMTLTSPSGLPVTVSPGIGGGLVVSGNTEGIDPSVYIDTALRKGMVPPENYGQGFGRKISDSLGLTKPVETVGDAAARIGVPVAKGVDPNARGVDPSRPGGSLGGPGGFVGADGHIFDTAAEATRSLDRADAAKAAAEATRIAREAERKAKAEQDAIAYRKAEEARKAAAEANRIAKQKAAEHIHVDDDGTEHNIPAGKSVVKDSKGNAVKDSKGKAVTSPNRPSDGGGGGGGGGGDGCFSADTKFFMADGSLKAIKDIKVGDVMNQGGRVYGILQGDGKISHWYTYGISHVTGSHFVLEDRWLPIEKSEGAKRSSEGFDTWYCVLNEHHLMLAEDLTLFTDFDAVDSVNDELEEMLNDK